MSLKLFKVTQDEIFLVSVVTPDDIILVSDEENKRLYLYRGKYSGSLDNFESEALYGRIIERFLNPNIFLITILDENKGNNNKILKIKKFIKSHYSETFLFKLNHYIGRIFLFEGFRDRIKKFKNYENSYSFRSKLSNSHSLWKLSLFNITSTILVIIILIWNLFWNLIPNLGAENTIEQMTLNLMLENFGISLALCIFILFVNFLSNSAFFLFPMKFPIKPSEINVMKEKEKKYNEIKKEKEKNVLR